MSTVNSKTHCTGLHEFQSMRLFVCLPFNLLVCSSSEEKKSFPEPISQYTLSSSSPYQHTKLWCSYVMSEKQKQGGGLLSCVRGWGLRGGAGSHFLSLSYTVASLSFFHDFTKVTHSLCLSVCLSLCLHLTLVQLQGTILSHLERAGWKKRNDNYVAVLMGITSTCKRKLTAH